MNRPAVRRIFRYSFLLAALLLIGAGLAPSPARALQPPRGGCRFASKIEYDSAKRQYLLRTRVGEYLRTGGWWRRHYWFCHR